METFKVGIDPVLLGAIAIGVVTLTELTKKSNLIADGYGLLVAAIFSALGIGLCAWEFHIASPLSIFLGFASILAQAAGAWGITRSLTPDQITTARKVAMLFAVLVPTTLTLSACGARSNQRAGFVRADSAIYTSLAALQDTAIALNKAGTLKDDDHKRVHAALAPALRTGLNINRVIRSWPADAPVPSELRELVSQVADLTRAVLQEIPAGEARDRLTAGITIVQQAILTVMIGVQGPIPVTQTGALIDGTEGERRPHMGASGVHAHSDRAQHDRATARDLLAA